MEKNIFQKEQNSYLSERAKQLSIGEFTAFGIPVCSRYSCSDEVIQLIRFAEDCANNNVNLYVKEVFYDSKAGFCNIELDGEIKFDNNPIAKSIFECARRNIGEFSFFGIIFHAYGCGCCEECETETYEDVIARHC